MHPGNDAVVWLYWVDDPNGKPRPAYLDVCLKSVYARSDCEIRLCNQAIAHDLLPELPKVFDKLIPPHQADVFRVGVLAKYGGMYIDCDTFVLKSLRSLFGLLNDYEFVGADWYPTTGRDQAPLDITTLGPARPKLAFLLNSFSSQLSLLRSNSNALLDGSAYPFQWEELLRDVVVPCFVRNRPYCILKNGAKTWAALVGGPAWRGGDYGHMLMPLRCINDQLPDTELLTICQSVWPDEVRSASLEVLKKQDTILAHLIKMVENEVTSCG